MRSSGVADEDVALDRDADSQPRRHARRLTTNTSDIDNSFESS